MITKRLEILTEAVPNASRIGVILNPKNPTNPLQVKDLQKLAPLLRITLVSFEIEKPDDFKPAFVMMNNARVTASIVMGDPMLSASANGVCPWAGGLMVYGPNDADMYRRAATFVDKILKGAKPADLPVERPVKFDLIINLKTAKQIGLAIPANVLARADRVIR